MLKKYNVSEISFKYVNVGNMNNNKFKFILNYQITNHNYFFGIRENFKFPTITHIHIMFMYYENERTNMAWPRNCI